MVRDILSDISELKGKMEDDMVEGNVWRKAGREVVEG